MPLNWDISDHEAPSDVDAAGELWETEPQDHFPNLSNGMKVEQDCKSEKKVKAEEPTASGLCPHCGSSLDITKPSVVTSAEIEVVVYTDCDRSSAQSSTSTTPSSSRSWDIKPDNFIDLTLLTDNEDCQETATPIRVTDTSQDHNSVQRLSTSQGSDSDIVRINPFTATRVNSWTYKEKQDLYVLKVAYSVNNEEISKILSRKHRKPRSKSSVVAQFAKYRYKALNNKLYVEVATAIIKDELYQYSDFTGGLKSAAQKVGIALSLRGKGEVRIPDIRVPETSPAHRNTRRDRGDDEYCDSDSSVSSSKWNLSDDGTIEEHQTPHRPRRPIQKLAPEILYRAYNRSSHGRNGIDGFRAGKFAGSDNQVPILADSELEGLDVSLAYHIEGEKMDEGSYFVSTTPSLLWALHKAFRMRKNARISIIDRSKIRQPMQHISTIRPRMRAKGLLEGISYSGKLEYVVYGEIEADGIINDFSLEKFLQMVNSDNQIQKVLGSDILFNRAYQKSLMKFDLICQSPIRRWSLAHVVGTVFKFIFDQRTSHPLEELFKTNFSIDWGLEGRME
ncbi:hypothetical protein TWF703_010000 [Orbilia oligospora]|uniref:DUF7587 domain-containing protein n=1 Tax=Orbilia oligospora TaxID=2813651 RepID=A0A7C8P280_ORBOL|nr:hypothetical protein TWF703_010000 [Orbilia oligospora]